MDSFTHQTPTEHLLGASPVLRAWNTKIAESSTWRLGRLGSGLGVVEGLGCGGPRGGSVHLRVVAHLNLLVSS